MTPMGPEIIHVCMPVERRPDSRHVARQRAVRHRQQRLQREGRLHPEPPNFRAPRSVGPSVGTALSHAAFAAVRLSAGVRQPRHRPCGARRTDGDGADESADDVSGAARRPAGRRRSRSRVPRPRSAVRARSCYDMAADMWNTVLAGQTGDEPAARARARRASQAVETGAASRKRRIHSPAAARSIRNRRCSGMHATRRRSRITSRSRRTHGKKPDAFCWGRKPNTPAF